MSGLLKFKPVLMERIWGGSRLKTEWGYESSLDTGLGECWVVSCNELADSEVTEGEYKGKRLSQLWKEEAEIFGEEIIMDADDNPIGNVDKYLLNAGGLSARQVVEECHKYGGRAVYAHIDNTSFSVLSVLGTIPEDIPIDGVELHDLSKRHDLVKAGLLDEDMPYMSDSDAHYLENIGDRGCTLLPDIRFTTG